MSSEIKLHRKSISKKDGHVKVYEKDCTECQNFTTNSLSYPSGFCILNKQFCGLDYTCDLFKEKEVKNN